MILAACAASATGQDLFSSGRVNVAAGTQLTGSQNISAGTLFASSNSRSSAASDFALERQVFDLINKTRAENGDEPLVWSDRAAAVAREHSADMASNKYFSHRGTDGSMVDDRAERVGLTNWQAIGENIAFVGGVPNPAEFTVARWMESPAHRSNLLDKRWTESAIGVALRPDGTIYFTQVFILKF
jgi:uncharacterized protein YkwD